MAGVETLFTFGIYMVFLMGGRGMGSWVTALSAQTGGMSGWLLMVYLSGMNQAWIAIGLLSGTYLNWKFVAPRPRVQTEETDTMTISIFSRVYSKYSGNPYRRAGIKSQETNELA